MTGIFNARILASLAMLVFVGAAIAASTGAFFSDTETSTGNTFTAGAIDLQIDNTSYGFDWNDPTNQSPSGVWGQNTANSWALSDLDGELFFSFSDLKPGDYGEDTISLHVNNNDAYACMAFDLTGTPENGQNEPEADVDATAGADEGELQNYLSFLFWHDDGDNVLEVDEEVIQELSGLPGTIFTGGWLPIAEGGDTPLAAETTNYVGKGWCFGTITATPAPEAANASGPTVGNTGFTCTGAAGDHNDAQTDGLAVDVGFYAVQSRNNASFQCATLPPMDGEGGNEETIIVNADDLATTTGAVNGTNWFFYNDTNDTVMTINQFSGTGGVNDIVAGPGAFGAAQMTLDSGVNPRYNIATTKYGNTNLADIGTMSYRIYDASASSQTPYLHFNVDFNDTNVFQSRLVQVPTGVVEDTWTTVDAIAGSWTYSGANWPAPNAQPGTTPKTWAQILVDYPNAEMLGSPAAFLGVRVGHPGPNGEESYVDWVEVDGETTDFEI